MAEDEAPSERDFLKPLRTLFDWIEAQPEVARSELVADLLESLPQKLYGEATGLDFWLKVRSALEALPGDPFECAGLAHMIASLVDGVLEGKDEDYWWDLERQQNLDYLTEFGESPHTRAALESIPFARRLWAQVIASWQKLRQGELSYPVMYVWANNLLLSSSR